MSKNKKQKTMEHAAALRILFSPNDLQNLDEKKLMQLFPSLENKEEILEQVRSQEKGIPLEYQFGAICWWLGKCKHFQFIDTQPEFPYLSKIENVKYPDAFAVFNYNNHDFPCFIQIKSYNNKQLKMSAKYVSGLKKYPLLKGYPLLIAWKFREFWFLFDIDTFISESGGINVKFEDAGRANLMSVLCGDFVFSGFKKGTNFYLVMETEKDDLIRFKNNMSFKGKCIDYCFFIPRVKTTKISEDIQEVYVNTPEAESTSDESRAATSLMMELTEFLGVWESITRSEDKYVYIGWSVEKTMGIYASQVLPIVSYRASIKSKQKVDWKDSLKERKFKYTINDVKKMIEFGQITKIGFEGIHFLPGISNPCIDAEPQSTYTHEEKAMEKEQRIKIKRVSETMV